MVNPRKQRTDTSITQVDNRMLESLLLGSKKGRKPERFIGQNDALIKKSHKRNNSF